MNRPQHVLDLAAKVFEAYLGGLVFTTLDGAPKEHLTFGVPGERLPSFLRSAWTGRVLDLVLRRRGAVRLAAAGDVAELGALTEAEAPGPFLAASLAIPGPSRAVFYLARRPGKPAFTENDEEILALFASGLEQGNLGEEARLVAQLGLLNRVVQAAAGNLELTSLLQAALRELDRHLPLHACAVWLTTSPDEAPASTDLLLAQTSAPGRDDPIVRELSAGRRVPLAETPFRACVTEGQAVYADWTRPEERDGPLAERLVAAGATACFAVPLRAADRILGVLQCVSARRGGFTNEQVQILYLVADLLGSAVSNCQLFGRLHGAYEELRRTQAQLVHAEKMRVIGELTCSVAHEFNNALCGVLGFVELALGDDDLGARPRGLLESARDCAFKAADAVRRVRDLNAPRRDGAAPPRADLASAPVLMPEPRGLHVLVVEDEETVRRFLDLGLRRLGHRARLAVDVSEGLAALAEEAFDVVLTDLGLPDGSGADMARAAAGTPVVMLTGWADLLAESPEGVARVLGKPVTLSALARALDEVCPPTASCLP